MFFFHVCLMRLHQFIPSIAFPDQLRPWRYVDQGQHGQLGWGFVVPSQWGGGPLSTKVWHHTHPQTFGAKHRVWRDNKWGQIPMFFFVSLGDVFDAYGTPLMTSHDLWNWGLVGVWNISCHSSMYTNVGLWPSSEVWIWYGFTKTYVYYLVLSYVLDTVFWKYLSHWHSA